MRTLYKQKNRATRRIPSIARFLPYIYIDSLSLRIIGIDK